MEKEFVSVIITTYKRPPSIVMRAVKSVFAQTYEQIELIVVDDSPKDYSERKYVEQAVQAFDGKIHYIKNETNLGACASRNIGIKEAHGKYVAFLDDDDEWDPTKIEKQVCAFNRPQVGLVYCGCIHQNMMTGKTYPGNVKYMKGHVYDELLYSNFICGCSFPLILKCALTECGGFDENLQSAQDYDMWLRIAKQYEVEYVPEQLVIYHSGEGENITGNIRKKISGKELMNKKYASEFERNRKLWWIHHVQLIFYYAKDGQKKKAISMWFNCVKKQPYRVFSNSYYLLKMFKAYK